MNKYLQSLYTIMPNTVQNLMLTGYSVILDRERYDKNFRRYVDILSKTQWYSESEFQGYQNEHLAKLVTHAYETVPYYNKIFREKKLKPSDIKCTEDLTKLPVLTKQDIINNSDSIVSSSFNPKSLKIGYTSGSTGSPLGAALT